MPQPGWRTNDCLRQARPGRLATRLRWALLGLFACVAAASAADLRWNHTASLPIGLYRASAAERIERGNIVLFCLEPQAAGLAKARGYLATGRCPGGVEPLGKPVVAVAGDVVDHTAESVRVNGRSLPLSATASRDSRGRPLTHPPFGTRTLGSGELWVLSSHHPRSFDSRYYGPVAVGRVRAVLAPVITFGGR